MEGGCYAVTFRLNDSLPREARESLVKAREALAEVLRAGGTLTPCESRLLAKVNRAKVEAWLDTGRGECHLARREVADTVARAMLTFNGRRYRLAAWCVMPNHVHAVFQPFGEGSLSGIMHSWKSYTAHECNRILGRSGTFWQRESYDRLLRNGSEVQRAIEYTVTNPERAG